MQLSVIIPVYNVEKYVARAIESVLQNDLPASDYEIVVVDDESPDGSLAIVQEFAARHAMIKIISQQNKGLGGARNTGIANASGDYILFLDADDWINPGMLSQLLLQATQNKLDILEFGAQGIDPDGKVVFTVAMASDGKVYNGLEYARRFDYMWSACNKLYHADFLKTQALYFEEHIYSEDFEYFTRVMPKVQRIMAIETIAAGFFQSADSITRNTSRKKKKKLFADLLANTERLKSALEATQDPAARAFYNTYATLLVTTLFFQFVKNGEPFTTALVYRRKLRKKGLWFTRHQIRPFSKDLFRRVFLNQFALLRVLMYFKKSAVGKK